MQREQAVSRVRSRAEDAARDRVLEILLPQPNPVGFSNEPAPVASDSGSSQASTRQKMLRKLLSGELDEREIEFDVTAQHGVEIMTPPGMEEMASQLQGMFQNLGGNKTMKRKMRIKDALPLLLEEESAKLINDEEIKQQALESAEQNGIVFIDELDKVAKRSEYAGADVSREGVQRDLLPLVEGSTVSTRYGMVKTDHMLFIASGAFHLSKPSDLIPELQGRLPIRVELRALDADDFYPHIDRTQSLPDRAILRPDGHRRCQAEIRQRQCKTYRRNRLAGERKHRKHRCETIAHRHGAAAGYHLLRGT